MQYRELRAGVRGEGVEVAVDLLRSHEKPAVVHK